MTQSQPQNAFWRRVSTVLLIGAVVLGLIGMHGAVTAGASECHAASTVRHHPGQHDAADRAVVMATGEPTAVMAADDCVPTPPRRPMLITAVWGPHVPWEGTAPVVPGVGWHLVPAGPDPPNSPETIEILRT